MVGFMQFSQGNGNVLFLHPPIGGDKISQDRINEVVQEIVKQVKGRKDKNTVIAIPEGWSILEKERPFAVAIPGENEVNQESGNVAPEGGQLYEQGYEQRTAAADALVLNVGPLPMEYREMICQFAEAVTAAARANLRISFDVKTKSDRI